MRRDGASDAGRMSEPLLLLPGLLCDTAAWQPVADLLAEADCRIETLPDRPTLGEIAEALLAQAPPRFALAGHSMGARVALEMVRREPARVTRVALLDTGFTACVDDETERRQRYALLTLAREQGMRAMGVRWSQRMLPPDRLDDAALVDGVLAMIERSTTDRFARQIEALLARPDAGDVLATIACPALVLCGRDDGWAPLAQHEALHARIGGSRLVVIGGCGHMAPVERPREVVAALRAWLAQGPPGRAAAPATR